MPIKTVLLLLWTGWTTLLRRHRGRSAPTAVVRASLWLSLAWLPLAHAGLPTIQSWTTPQGTRVLLLENRSLPMLDVRVDFDAGSRRDAAGKAGQASFAFGLMTLGAAGRDENELARAEVDLGAAISTGVDSDGAVISLRTLSEAPIRDAAVQLLVDVLTRPDYPAPVLEREKTRLRAQLQQARTDPGSLAADRFGALLYGDHPYGRTNAMQLAALDGLTRADLLDFHRRHVVAPRAVIAMVGDISRADAERLALRIAGALPATAPELPLLPPVVFATPAASERLDFPSSQAHLLLGMPYIARNDPDFFALALADYILGGGGFNSRLTRVLREEKGLTYSVYSTFQAQLQPGPLYIGLQTRKEKADEALVLVRRVVEGLVRQGPTEDELRQAKADLINSFSISLDTNRKWLGMLARIGRHNLPLDYLHTYDRNIRSVTVAQVRAALQRHLDPQKLVSVVVGYPQGEAQRVSQ